MTNADIFTKRDPPEQGGNKIPQSYLDRMSIRSRGPAMAEPDDFAEMPWYLQRFVRSVCTI